MEQVREKIARFFDKAEGVILEKTVLFKIHSFIADNSQEKLSFPAK